MERCKHQWIDVGDGTHDKICPKCNRRAKQAVAYLLLNATSISVNSLTTTAIKERVAPKFNQDMKDHVSAQMSRELMAPIYRELTRALTETAQRR